MVFFSQFKFSDCHYLLDMTAIVVSPISDQLKCMNHMMNARNAPVSRVAAFTYLI